MLLLSKKASKQIVLLICEAKAIWFTQVFVECFICSFRESLYSGIGGHSDIRKGYYIGHIVFDIGGVMG